jgi:exonuclease SbcC
MLAEVVDQLVGLDARGTSDLGAGEVESEEAGEMVDATQLALGTSAGRLERLADLHVEATAARERRTLLVARLEVLATLERAYGRDGIPALILESSAIPHIEAEAARVLWELGTPFRIQLQTQRETKSGTLKDTLDVIVHEPNGSRRYETYSGGERTRLELALRIGLARLLAHRADVQIGLLALDEPAFLDAAGIYQLAIVLVGLLDEFASIVLISHDEKLTDVFNQVVLVRRERGVSRIVNEGTADA